jgi:dipeptide/tripeptide permease
MSGAFTISVIVLILMFFLSNIASNTKSEILKKAINSPRATHIHILIVVLLFGGVFWQASAMILIGISIISSIVLVILVISKMKEKIKKKDESKNFISKSF